MNTCKVRRVGPTPSDGILPWAKVLAETRYIAKTGQGEAQLRKILGKNEI
jgi:hypothetical protein